MTDEEKLSKQGDIPIWIQFMSLFYPVTNYVKEYGEDGKSTINESKGEIFKFNFANSYDYGMPIGKQVVGLSWDAKGEYDAIWRHLGQGWFKLTSKVR